MVIKEIQENSVWSAFFNANGSPSFHQTWEWGDFENRRQHDVIRLGFFEDTEIVAIAQVIKMRVKRGDFLFVPHGPIVKHDKYFSTTIHAIRDYLIEVGKREKFDFIRIAPSTEDLVLRQTEFKQLGFKKAAIFIHSERSWVLDLYKPDGSPIPEEELLSNMRKTTRYSIRKAAKEGVTIDMQTDATAVDTFYDLFMETVQREQFSAYTREYIADELDVFKAGHNAVFFFARLASEPRPLAAALILFTQSSAFYHQGASIHHKIPAPYLLQWEAIKEAQKRGCRYYNFYGIAHNDKPDHPWAGLTLFKTGFGGRVLNYVPTQDYPLTKKYLLTRGYEKWLRWKRKV